MSPVIGNLVSGELQLNIVFRKCEDGGYIAECMEIPGCMSQGDTQEEAKIGIHEAIEACMSVMLEDSIRAACLQTHPRNVVGIDLQETLSVVPPHLLATAGA
jgi:predicted RNase H-like HicB family nuclease